MWKKRFFMKNKKIVILAAIVLVAIVSLLCIFTCVFGTHKWTEADCVSPKTCLKCGKTEGEALGHDYTTADCLNAASCKRCGEKSGEALGHNYAGRNYQENANCARCGADGIGPLPADFETYGLSGACDVVFGEAYAYTTSCRDDAEKTTTGTVTYSDYSRFEGDENHEALSGYEWETVTVSLTFADENAVALGMNWDVRSEDYYDIKGYEASFAEIKTASDEKAYSFTVNYFGKDYTDCLKQSECQKAAWSKDTYTVTYKLYYRIPVGYDGITVGVQNMAVSEEGKYIFDQAEGCVEHFCRLN